MENVGGLGKQCIALYPYLVSGATSLAPQRQHGPDCFPDAPPWPINLFSFFNLLFLFTILVFQFFLEFEIFISAYFFSPASPFAGGRGVLAAGDGADLVLARLQFGHLVRCLLMRAVADAALPLIRVREKEESERRVTGAFLVHNGRSERIGDGVPGRFGRTTTRRHPW